MLSSISLRYAQALADVAGRAEQASQIQNQLIAFGKLLNEHRKLRDIFVSPVIPFSAKREIIQELASRLFLGQTVVNFLCVLLENARMHQFGEVLKAYRNVLEGERGILSIEAYTPLKMDDSLKKDLEKIISTITGSNQVKFKCHLDETLLGGIKLRIGSTIIDGSIRTQLENFQKQLEREKNHGN